LKRNIGGSAEFADGKQSRNLKLASNVITMQSLKKSHLTVIYIIVKPMKLIEDGKNKTF